MNDRPQWFAPKTYGYGNGLPIAWQGWVIFIGYLSIVLLGAAFLAPLSVVAYLALFASLTIALAWVAKNTTRGGWRWRRGEKG